MMKGKRETGRIADRARTCEDVEGESKGGGRGEEGGGEEKGKG